MTYSMTAHLDKEPDARVEVFTANLGYSTSKDYLVIHLGEITVFPSWKQLEALSTAILSVLANRPATTLAAPAEPSTEQAREAKQ